MQTGRANVLPQGELRVPHYAQQGSVQPWGAKYGKLQVAVHEVIRLSKWKGILLFAHGL